MYKIHILLVQLLAVSFYSNPVQCQEVILRTSSVDTVNVNSMYKYRDFLAGTLHYRDGRAATSRFNINMLLDEIQFISARGDTLSLANENTIDKVVIGDHVYYYSKGTIEVVKSYKPVQLGLHRKIAIQIRKPRGAYGESMEFSSASNYGQLIYNNQSIKLEVNKEVLFTKKTEYYFMKEDKSVILPASKNNLYKVFREHHQKALSHYLSENKVNFRNEEDLCKLLSFCEQLAQKQ